MTLWNIKPFLTFVTVTLLSRSSVTPICDMSRSMISGIYAVARDTVTVTPVTLRDNTPLRRRGCHGVTSRSVTSQPVAGIEIDNPGGYFPTMWDRKSRIDQGGHTQSQTHARSRRARDLGGLVRCIPGHLSKALGISSSYKVELTGNHEKVTTEGGVFTPNVTFYTHTIPINREVNCG
jgi:hypothetical protein